MDSDPITYKKTIFEKIKDLYEKHILKPPMKNNYWVSPYEIDEHINTENPYEKLAKDWSKLGNAMLAAGCSFNDVRNALIQFGNAANNK